MHIHNPHVGRFRILRSPVICRAAVDHIPAKIVHRDNLRRYSRLLDDWPLRFPLISVLHYMKVKCTGGGSDNSRPMQLEINLCFVIGGMDWPALETVDG